ncbi:H2O-forming NADH oxidase [Candidatus Enterococcus ikei]|uniref:NADH oxidase n=1 Tax=Candidatus Enterococcus ikei TaxID=2815326 RepID=A0ABS3GX44_9ENTE|nr:FAD-dependent oxidoreductase [Enterococcus sp. DIV0869a]MBO0439385.1 FAD-dependent oxidoreductase [Enterococcus sp. DIV0869a]
MKKIVIVGGNHGGIAAANTIVDHSDNKVTIFEKSNRISYLGCGSALWLGEQIDEPESLFYTSKEGLQQKGIEVNLETVVEKIDFEQKLVFVSNVHKRWQESYDELILATGSIPILPSLPGIKSKNIQFIKSFDEAVYANQILEDESIKNIAVVGAGYIGVEMAEACKRRGKNVRLFDAASTCLSGYYDKEFSDMMAKNMEERGVKGQFNEKISEFKSNESGHVEKLVTDKGEYAIDFVFLAVGFKPNNLLGKEQLALFKNGAYLVDRCQQTSQKHVYAIGDCSTILNNTTGETDYIALATNAVRSGVVAGSNACGIPIETAGVQGSNGISIFGLNLFSTGWTYKNARQQNPDAAYVEHQDYQKPLFMKSENEPVTLRIVYDKKTRRILGAQLASRLDVSAMTHVFSLAIQEQLSIDKLKLLDIFFLPHFNTPYNYLTMAALKA